ncbi:MAG TPA: hypothetical protein VK557_05145 [Pyrinomonadaceae bacterium]|nr:hypothetical protein [Pyrinomonadaceae bacterium]
MNEEPTKDLATRAFQKRVLDEFAAMRAEQAAMRKDITEIRTDILEIRTQQAAMAKNIAALDQRVTSVETQLTSLDEKVDRRLQETRPIWEAVKAQIELLDAKFDNFILDLYDIRGELRLHEKRLLQLESRILS